MGLSWLTRLKHPSTCVLALCNTSTLSSLLSKMIFEQAMASLACRNGSCSSSTQELFDQHWGKRTAWSPLGQRRMRGLEQRTWGPAGELCLLDVPQAGGGWLSSRAWGDDAGPVQGQRPSVPVLLVD